MARILIVDDDKDILNFVALLLNESGYSVTSAESALQAIQLLHTEHFDAILSDINMPQFTGFELLTTLKKKPEYENTAIAMLTGVRDKEKIEKAIRLGVDDYIVKPIQPEDLLLKIKNLFQKKPPVNLSSIQISPQDPYSQADILIPLHIGKITEKYLYLYSSIELKEGWKTQIKGSLLSQLGLDLSSSDPHKKYCEIKIISSRKFNQEYECKAEILNLTLAQKSCLGNWILHKKEKNKSA